MKKFLILIISLLILVPTTVFAADTQALDFMQTFELAEIEPKVEDYKETDDQVTLYLFWWTNCSHCHEELEYLNDVLEEYKDKIKLRSYEIQNSDNSKLRNKVGDFFDITGKGVPLLIVGENSFYGFKDEYKEKIKTAIETEYNKTEKYDLFKEMETKDKYDGSNNRDADGEQKKEKSTTGLYLFAGVVVIGIFGFILFTVMKDQN